MHAPSLLLVQSLLGAEPQAVDAAPWTLQWSAPAECPTAAEVDGTVASWLSQAPSPVATTGVRARADVRQLGDSSFALQLTIEADQVVTAHAVEAADCRTLADATALQIAMALGIDPAAPPPAPATVPADSQADPVTTAPRTRATATPTTSAPAEGKRELDSPRGVLRLQGSVGTGRVPRIDGRLALAGGLAWPRARVEVIVGHTFEQRARHPDREGLAIRVWQWTVVARGCWTPHVGPLELPVCGGLEAGASQGKAVGVPRRRTATSPFVAAVATVGLAWPFARRFALWVAVDGWVAVTQPAFTVETLAPWFTTRRGGVDGVVGLEVRFP